jgi:hypothetical protein
LVLGGLVRGRWLGVDAVGLHALEAGALVLGNGRCRLSMSFPSPTFRFSVQLFAHNRSGCFCGCWLLWCGRWLRPWAMNPTSPCRGSPGPAFSHTPVCGCWTGRCTTPSTAASTTTWPPPLPLLVTHPLASTAGAGSTGASMRCLRGLVQTLLSCNLKGWGGGVVGHDVLRAACLVTKWAGHSVPHGQS